MKHLIIFCLALCLTFYGCSKLSVQPTEDFIELSSTTVHSAEELEQMDWRYATDEDLAKLQELGYLDTRKATNCQWKDGQGGSLNCDGGTCVVVFLTLPDGTEYAGMACMINGQRQCAGLYRQI